MRTTTITLPVLSVIAVTRGMFGAGLALLVGDRLSGKQKKAAGWTLFLVGAVTTAPLLMEVLGKSQEEKDPPGALPK